MSSTHSEGMQRISVIRIDGTRGAVVTRDTSGNFVVEFTDSARRIISPASLALQNDGTCLFSVDAAHPLQTLTTEELVIPPEDLTGTELPKR